jgi:hypothetical protein
MRDHFQQISELEISYGIGDEIIFVVYIKNQSRCSERLLIAPDYGLDRSFE